MNNIIQNQRSLRELPESWSLSSFDKLVNDLSGGNKKVPKSEYEEKGHYSIVDQGKELIAGYSNNEKYLVKGNAPYIVFGDHTRIFKYINTEFVMGADGIKVLQADKELCFLKYLFYFFLTLRIPNTGYNRHFKYLKQAQIPLPPLAEQKKIAALLDAADAYRQQTRALITKYDELAQSLFLDMFGDPVTNPMGWEKVKLGGIGDWKSGGTPSRKISEYFQGDIPWLSSGELNSMYTSESIEYITNEAIENSAAKIVEKGSLFLGMYDTAALKSTISTLPLSCNQAIAFSKIDEKKANTVFVYTTIQLGKEYYRRLQRGVRQKNLNLTMVKSIKIILPPLPLQNQFAERIQAIEAQKAQAEASLAQAEDLFGALLQEAFKAK